MEFSRIDYTAIGLVVLMVIGFFWFRGNLGSQPSDQSSVVPDLVIQLNPQNEFKETGTASFFDLGGKTKVVLDLQNLTIQDASQPAYIHAGSCDHPGVVLYTLTFPKNGHSETTLPFSFQDLLSKLPAIVDVYKSIPEITQQVSCGSIISN